MPPPRQTKTLASVREKLRAKRMLLEHQRSGPHPPLGSLTPNPGLSHTGNFYSSPFYRQPLTSPSTVSSACLSSSQLTALNIDAQFPSQSSAQQSSKCVLPLTSSHHASTAASILTATTTTGVTAAAAAAAATTIFRYRLSTKRLSAGHTPPREANRPTFCSTQHHLDSGRL
ncbi:unnamed protein product [Dibothriocephalus latus]|uniref:Uncharacterized protein n=1 Tax=Dibothriocephalus latus TaxID=60516 RepID=A0A3P7NIY0_DIBLA|nr:unnamed protein product [Dibothriocephalus latus]